MMSLTGPNSSEVQQLVIIFYNDSFKRFALLVRRKKGAIKKLYDFSDQIGETMHFTRIVEIGESTVALTRKSHSGSKLLKHAENKFT